MESHVWIFSSFHYKPHLFSSAFILINLPLKEDRKLEWIPKMSDLILTSKYFFVFVYFSLVLCVLFSWSWVWFWGFCFSKGAALWVSGSPDCKEVLVQILAGTFLCGVWRFSLFMCGFSLASFHSPKNMHHRLTDESKSSLGVNVCQCWCGPANTAKIKS